MHKFVPSIMDYVAESLNKIEWLNYKSDTSLNMPNVDEDINDVAAVVLRMLNENDPEKIIFTGSDISIGLDYKYFTENLVSKAQKKDETSIEKDGMYIYCALYGIDEHFFVQLDIRDTYEYSYVFMRESDFQFFNDIDKPIVPQPQQEQVPPQEQTARQVQQTPMQNTGTGIV